MSGETKSGKRGFTAGTTMDTQVSTPANARGKNGGSFDSPTSMKSKIVSPAPGGPKVKDRGITNKGL